MFQQIVVIFAVLLTSFAYPAEEDEIKKLEILDEMTPKDVKEVKDTLTDSELDVMKNLNESKYKTDDELFAAIKQKAPGLAAKLVKMRDQIKKRIDLLKPEAKAFIDEIFMKPRKGKKLEGEISRKELIKFLSKDALDTMNKYKKLSKEAKSDIRKQFPKFARALESKLSLCYTIRS
ncbi:unnamed protein product [Strongylus vulgaris]|uniref:Fatty-acid and retinol-binding protein 1 n=1 Tax=Strongylus vulgaris TaxID=40348 RepID=A0A3P7KNW1_STRVU|nr:unnamed protein product [Strongylus vulgaris]